MTQADELMVATMFWNYVCGFVAAVLAAYGVFFLYVWFRDRSK